MTRTSKPKNKEMPTNKKMVAVILIIVGAACLLGAGIFFLDSLTAAQRLPSGAQITRNNLALAGSGSIQVIFLTPSARTGAVAFAL